MQKILIANRGEIAIRVARACRDLGLRSVAVFSECDRAARHVRAADEAVAIGPSPPAESYLRIDRIVEAALASGADAVHPGYGFLSENPRFSAACLDAGLTFIGPPPGVVARMGSKTEARDAAIAAGVPVVPGSDARFTPDASDAAIAEAAARIGFPVMVKAVAGGGGKGMRVVVRPEDLPGAIRAARSEASTSFGDAAVYLERRIERPRHIEVQVLADQHGTVVPFVERECSIQRRHQKVIEESPSAVVSPALRARLAGAARAVAASVGYVNAGTIEFLVDADERFYFLEMNTRLQVEHPVTELVTGVDLVAWQIRIARGEPLTIAPASALTPRGHAIECRVYAEDPDAGFLPSPGTIAAIRVPDGPGIRDDSGVGPGSAITVYYDSLLSKLASWGEDRPQAIARMARALDEYDVLGVKTSLPFLRWMLAEPAFAAAAFHTEYLDGLLQQRGGGAFGTWQVSQEEVAAIAAAVHEAMCREAAGASRPAAPGTAVPLGSGGGGGSAWKRAGRLEGLRP